MDLSVSRFSRWIFLGDSIKYSIDFFCLGGVVK